MLLEVTEMKNKKRVFVISLSFVVISIIVVIAGVEFQRKFKKDTKITDLGDFDSVDI